MQAHIEKQAHSSFGFNSNNIPVLPNHISNFQLMLMWPLLTWNKLCRKLTSKQLIPFQLRTSPSAPLCAKKKKRTKYHQSKKKINSSFWPEVLWRDRFGNILQSTHLFESTHGLSKHGVKAYRFKINYNSYFNWRVNCSLITSFSQALLGVLLLSRNVQWYPI